MHHPFQVETQTDGDFVFQNRNNQDLQRVCIGGCGGREEDQSGPSLVATCSRHERLQGNKCVCSRGD